MVVQLVVMAVYLMDKYSGNDLHVQNGLLHNTVNEVVGNHHALKIIININYTLQILKKETKYLL